NMGGCKAVDPVRCGAPPRPPAPVVVGYPAQGLWGQRMGMRVSLGAGAVVRDQPIPVAMPPSAAPAPAQAGEGISQVCGMLKKFSLVPPGSKDESDARGGIFWSYVDGLSQKGGMSQSAILQ